MVRSVKGDEKLLKAVVRTRTLGYPLMKNSSWGCALAAQETAVSWVVSEEV